MSRWTQGTVDRQTALIKDNLLIVLNAIDVLIMHTLQMSERRDSGGQQIGCHETGLSR